MQRSLFFLTSLILFASIQPAVLSAKNDTNHPSNDGPFLGNGFKVGEADQSTVLIWTRLTSQKAANFDKLPILTEGLPVNQRSKIPMPLGILPGRAGEIRIIYSPIVGQPAAQKQVEEKKTEWLAVNKNKDFTRQFKLVDLHPATKYQVTVECKSSGSSKVTDTLKGHFQTAPAAADDTEIRFIVSTCQAVRSIDSGKQGHIAYRQMKAYQPDFFVHTGDILYYDKVPLCKNVAQARAKWNLMFAYEHNQQFHQHVSSYFMKDDHDTLKNDCWPGQTYGDLTFAEGLDLFREQVCMGEKTYRTRRWGKHVQIWMTENRDFRSSNRMPDGPEKTILGTQQKEWLLRTVKQSDATFKFIISPGPIVGPDKKGKADNHANGNFKNEGQQLRDFLSTQKNTYVICGDRHWQYCSKDPQTGLIEMGCGPINDEHSFGGNPGNQPEFHRYFSGKGGFLAIEVDAAKATAKWFTANDKDKVSGQPKVRYQEVFLNRK